MSLQGFAPTPRFEQYRETFKDFYRMERRDDGVLLVAAHTSIHQEGMKAARTVARWLVRHRFFRPQASRLSRF